MVKKTQKQEDSDLFTKEQLRHYLGSLQESHTEDLRAIKDGFVVINNKLDSHTEMIGEMKEDISVLKSDMIVVKEDISVLKSDMIVVKEDISVLKSDMIVVKEDISVLKSDMIVVKEDISVLKSDMIVVKEDIKEIKSDLKKKVDYSEFIPIVKKVERLGAQV